MKTKLISKFSEKKILPIILYVNVINVDCMTEGTYDKYHEFKEMQMRNKLF